MPSLIKEVDSLRLKDLFPHLEIRNKDIIYKIPAITREYRNKIEETRQHLQVHYNKYQGRWCSYKGDDWAIDKVIVLCIDAEEGYSKLRYDVKTSNILIRYRYYFSLKPIRDEFNDEHAKALSNILSVNKKLPDLICPYKVHFDLPF